MTPRNAGIAVIHKYGILTSLVEFVMKDCSRASKDDQERVW